MAEALCDLAIGAVCIAMLMAAMAIGAESSESKCDRFCGHRGFDECTQSKVVCPGKTR